jgi:hypothetical protein
MTGADEDARAAVRMAEASVAIATTHVELIGSVLALLEAIMERIEDQCPAPLAHAVEGGLQRPVQAAPPPLTTPEAHRAAHRPGRPSRLDTDPELRAFVMARLGQDTFDEIVAAVAAAFPPDRRIRRSALHAWWKRNSSAPPAIRHHPP